MTKFRFAALALAAWVAIGSAAHAQGPPTPPPFSSLGSYSSLSVTNSSAATALPAAVGTFGAVTLYNSGLVDAYFAFGSASVVATTSPSGVGAGKVPAGTFLTVFATGPYIAVVTASSTTTVQVFQATGPIQFGLVGSGGGGGSPTGPAGGDLGGTYPSPTVVSLSNVTDGSLANTGLAHSSMTIAGHVVALGGTQTLACADLTNAGALCSVVPGTGVATALAVNIGTAGSFVVNGGALGTPSSGLASNLTGLPISTGVSGLGTGIATALGVNVGSAGAPVLFNGAGGTPSSLVGTNITGTASGLTAGNVTTNANLTGQVTSVGNATTIATTQPDAHTWAATQTFTLAPVFTDGSGSRSALGLGTSATVNTGASGATIPLLNAANTFSGQLTNALGTITTSQPLTITQTWNAAGVTFNSLLVNVTSSASAALSLLTDLQVGGSSKFNVDKSGNATASGFYLSGGSQGFIWTNSTGSLRINSTSSFPGLHLAGTNSNGIAWTIDNDSASAVDTTLSRNAAGIVQVGTTAANALGSLALLNVTAGGWLHWSGETRVTTQFDKTSSVTLANVPGLSATVTAGRTYQFHATLYTSSDVAGGVQAAIGGTATATTIIYEGQTTATSTINAQTRATALAASVGAVTAVTAGRIDIFGTITVNAGGTLTVQFAQNASNGSASSVLVGSTFIVQEF